MSIYRVHFMWKDKARTIEARGLDMTHPYFVSITELLFPERSTVIIDPNDDELRREFGEAHHIMIPFQSVQLIEELSKNETESDGKVIPFSVAERDDDG